MIALKYLDQNSIEIYSKVKMSLNHLKMQIKNVRKKNSKHAAAIMIMTHSANGMKNIKKDLKKHITCFTQKRDANVIVKTTQKESKSTRKIAKYSTTLKNR